METVPHRALVNIYDVILRKCALTHMNAQNWAKKGNEEKILKPLVASVHQRWRWREIWHTYSKQIDNGARRRWRWILPELYKVDAFGRNKFKCFPYSHPNHRARCGVRVFETKQVPPIGECTRVKNAFIIDSLVNAWSKKHSRKLLYPWVRRNLKTV